MNRRGQTVSNWSMTRSNKARFFNVTVTAVAVFAWFTSTNHCLLGLLKQPGNMAVSMTHCPDHSEKPSRMSACCQGLQSANFQLAKAKLVFSPLLVVIEFLALSRLALPEAPASVIPGTTYDTGPPTSYFVRTVLRRSLRENAPPLPF